MHIEVTAHIHHHDSDRELDQLVAQAIALLCTIKEGQETIMATQQELEAKLTEVTAQVGDIGRGVTGLAEEVADLIANLGPAGPPPDLTLALSQAQGIQDGLVAVADKIKAIPPKPV